MRRLLERLRSKLQRVRQSCIAHRITGSQRHGAVNGHLDARQRGAQSQGGRPAIGGRQHHGARPHGAFATRDFHRTEALERRANRVCSTTEGVRVAATGRLPRKNVGYGGDKPGGRCSIADGAHPVARALPVGAHHHHGRLVESTGVDHERIRPAGTGLCVQPFGESRSAVQDGSRLPRRRKHACDVRDHRFAPGDERRVGRHDHGCAQKNEQHVGTSDHCVPFSVMLWLSIGPNA